MHAAATEMLQEPRKSADPAADVACYSQLIQADEQAALAALQAHRRDLVDPLPAPLAAVRAFSFRKRQPW